MQKLIYVCSPLRGDIHGNRQKAAQYCKKVAAEGHIPFAPHLYFTEFLDDTNPTERELGMQMGIDFIQNRMNPQHDELWVFGERISEGMQHEINLAYAKGIPITQHISRQIVRPLPDTFVVEIVIS